MKLIRSVLGLFIISVFLLSNTSCKKKFDSDDESENGTKSPSKGARIASVTNYLTDQSAVNLFDLIYNYAGYGNDSSSVQNKKVGYEHLVAASNNGIKVIRFFAAGAYNESSINCPVVQLWKSNRAAFYAAFDQLVSDANSLGIQLVPSLVTGFSDTEEMKDVDVYYNSTKSLMGSIAFLDTLYVKRNGVTLMLDCINNPGACKNRSEMRQYALDIVSRYKNSNAILYWEIANEINLERQSRNTDKLILPESNIRSYLASMAADIKAIDNMHMLDGGIINENSAAENDYYLNYYLRGNPNIDIVSVHLYEPTDKSPEFYHQPPAVLLEYFSKKASALGKALVIGETGVNSAGWGANNFNSYIMSMLLAKTYLKVPLAIAWTWQSKIYNSASHPEMGANSIDPGEDNDAISVLNRPTYHMGNNNIQFSYPITGDFNGDGHDDFGVKTDRGLFQLSLVNNFEAGIPSQWLGPFGDKNSDPGGAPYVPVTGDWDGDGKTDIGMKARDGRWYVAFSDPANGRFTNWGLWLSNYGNDNSDPGGAPFEPITGDWNGDGKTDIGFRAKDGRWYIAISDPANRRFTNLAHWLSNMGNDYADPAGAPFRPVTGDWNGDGKTDIGVKGKDGRWIVAFSDPEHGRFTNPEVWAPRFGDDSYDPGGAPFLPITGDWNGDGKTDIGMKSKDGRWYVEFSDPVSRQFVNPAHWLSGFGDDYYDPGSAPFVPITGDWNNDGRTDIGLKTTEGRWFGALTVGNSFSYQKTFF